MNEVRRAFLDCGAATVSVVSAPEVAARWDEPSALELFSIRGLSGHLVRATGSVEAYLDRGVPEGPPISAAEYYAAAIGHPDPSSDLHVAVRARGEAEASEGHAALVDKLEGILGRLSTRLDDEPEDRLVRVFQDLVLTLDDYLVTRLVEQVVHLDDLCVSIGIDCPEVPATAMELALGNLLAVARVRHGDVAVLRAFSRRERDPVDALRVF